MYTSKSKLFNSGKYIEKKKNRKSKQEKTKRKEKKKPIDQSIKTLNRITAKPMEDFLRVFTIRQKKKKNTQEKRKKSQIRSRFANWTANKSTEDPRELSFRAR